MSIGVVHFPCPRCSTSTPVHVANVDEKSHFTCRNVKCGFVRAFGDKFPSITKLLEKLAHLDADIARAKVVDALTAWYLDWTSVSDAD